MLGKMNLAARKKAIKIVCVIFIAAFVFSEFVFKSDFHFGKTGAAQLIMQECTGEFRKNPFSSFYNIDVTPKLKNVIDLKTLKSGSSGTSDKPPLENTFENQLEEAGFILSDEKLRPDDREQLGVKTYDRFISAKKRMGLFWGPFSTHICTVKYTVKNGNVNALNVKASRFFGPNFP